MASSDPPKIRSTFHRRHRRLARLAKSEQSVSRFATAPDEPESHHPIPQTDFGPFGMKALFYAFCIFLVVWWFFLRDTSAPAPEPGIKIKGAPEQSATTLQKWTEKNYEIRPLARYHIKARILSKKRYYFDATADISPMDLALGWDEMSDSGTLKYIGVSQSGRWYSYYYPADCPVAPGIIATQSANVHCLPANSNIWSELRDLRVNSFVELKGFLVEAQKAGAQQPWTSSLVRDDQGAGACEIFWITEVNELSP